MVQKWLAWERVTRYAWKLDCVYMEMISRKTLYHHQVRVTHTLSTPFDSNATQSNDINFRGHVCVLGDKTMPSSVWHQPGFG